MSVKGVTVWWLSNLLFISDPCPRLYINSSSNALLLRQIIGRIYSHQEHTFPRDLVYIGPGKPGSEDMIYLAYNPDRGRWQFGYHLELPLAYAQDRAATPQDVSTLWILRTGERVSLHFFCAGKIFIDSVPFQECDTVI